MASLEAFFLAFVIDGSRGEGGGQMLPFGVALSVMLGITLKFVNTPFQFSFWTLLKMSKMIIFFFLLNT